MVEWKEYRIKDLGEVVTGNTPPTSNREYYGTEYKFIKPTDMVEGQRFVSTTEEYYSELAYQKYKKCLLPPKTPCVVTIGSLGKKMCLTDTECFTNQAVNAVIPNKENDGEFLYYAFKASVLAYVKQLDSGTTSGRENVSKSSFSKIKVRVPPLPTQQKIASILSVYDKLIQNYKKQIQALQTAASELYKEWFVRFRFPGYKNSRFENGIPEGWKVEKLFDVAKIIYGYPFNSDEFCDDSSLNPVVRIRDILDNYTNTYTSETCDEKYWINPNEMLIGMDGIFHMSLWTGKRALQNQRTVRVTSKVKNLSNYYLYFSLYPQIKALEQMIVGTTVAHLGDKHLKKITILIPEDKILKMSFERLEPIMNRIYSLQQQITNLTQQRDLLLPRLMSGKLEVE
ncbi:restriction endonuclease subunit S [uncultured Treponema sp.]|uniref:restriction endonuclease subunit S n=1 Tax=uncultured Treponema sp. TaxID=162155 RepID=UPI00258D9194|nr:restriction endonuclease subunit S [uncultured Treponema sp.]